MHFSAIKLAHAVFEPKTTGHASEQDSVLILHGLFGSKKNWESIAKALSQKGLKVRMTIFFINNYNVFFYICFMFHKLFLHLPYHAYVHDNL